MPTLPNLQDLAAAIRAADGQTPTAVLDAFLPRAVSHLGQRLLPLTAGHELLLAQTRHPLASGEKWEDADVLLALFIFSRPSRLLFSMVADDSFEAEFFVFIDSIPTADIPALGHDMVSHWLRSRSTALAMECQHATAQKKTADSAGSSALSARLARFTAGFQTWFSTRCHSPKSSP